MKGINRKFFVKAKNALKKKKVWIPTAACACAVTVCAVWSDVRSVRGGETGASLQSSKAVAGTLTNSIEGTGTLESGEGSSIRVPSGLTYEEVCVAAGDSVNAGDVLAKVNHASILAKMEEIQSEISAIDAEMEEAADDDSAESVTAGVSGTVTAVYVSEGDDVSSVMAEKGAIIEIAVGGDTSQIVGVTATEGTVDSLSVSAGDTVESGDTLCTLTVDGSSLAYQELAEERSTLVSGLQTLIQIAQTDNHGSGKRNHRERRHQRGGYRILFRNRIGRQHLRFRNGCFFFKRRGLCGQRILPGRIGYHSRTCGLRNG